MNPILTRLAVLLLLYALPLIPRAQVTDTRYPDGSPKSITTLGTDPGTFDWTFYHPGGRVAADGSVRNGIPVDGMRRAFYDNGNKAYEFEIKNGVNEGVFRTFYPGGELKVEGSLVHGMPEGMWTLWNDKGVRIIRGEFTADGRFKVIEARDVFRHQVIAEGEGELRFRSNAGYADGGKEVPVIVELTYKEGFKDGTRKETRLDGTAHHDGSFRNGRYQGEWVLYHDNGKPRLEYSFVNGIPSGTQTERNKTGRIIRTLDLPVVAYDSMPGSQYPLPPLPEDILWHQRIDREVPASLFSMEDLGFGELLADLLSVVADGSATAYRVEFMTQGTEYRASDVVGNSILDTLSLANSAPLVNTYTFDAAHVSALVITEDWYYDKQYDCLKRRVQRVGLKFGEGDTALYRAWYPVEGLRASGHEGIGLLLGEIDSKVMAGIPNWADFEQQFSEMDPATFAYMTEAKWVELNAHWMEVLSAQLNLRGVDRKAP